ncbi:MAG: hypothetical protein AB8B74_09430, partial [Crocinitomicaceae bacterium]
LILSENSKVMWERVADRAMSSPKDLKMLFVFFKSTDIRLVQRATQSLSKIHDRDKIFLKPYFSDLIRGLGKPQIDAYKRNVLRIFQVAEIPKADEGFLFDKAFGYLESKTEAIAIKAFAMTVCRKIAERHSDLVPEIIDTIEHILVEETATGLLNRGKHEVIKLKKLL